MASWREEVAMDGSYKPEGYSSVSAYIVADGAQGVIDFLIKSFDARQARRFERPDGSIMHAEVQIDDTVVMIADGGGDNPAFPASLHVYVSDVDASYERALEAGGMVVDEPKRRDGDPDRRGGVKDPAGNTWWIATQVA
jgi:PhnB protein